MKGRLEETRQLLAEIKCQNDNITKKVEGKYGCIF
jgi:hypothetical protein